MSNIYLNQLSKTEYDELVCKLYIHQKEKCIICGKKIDNPHVNATITTFKQRHKFNFEDYALCHKGCDKGSIKNEILKQAIDNFEFIQGFALTVEVPTSEHVITDNEINYMDNISELDKQIQEKREQDEFWLKEEQIIKALTYYDKAKEHKRAKKYKNAITALEKAISILHNINCSHYSEIHSCLINCYQKINDTENQTRVIKLAIELYDNPKYSRMLNRINGKEKECLLNKESYQVTAQYNYGIIYDKHIKEHLPEFNFYHNKFNPFKHYDFEKDDMLPVIRTIDQYFHLTLNEAEKAEMSELYEEAVELYEQLIAEGIYTPNAYERLIVLYSKANRNNDVIRILQDGINYFEKRRNRQKEYVRMLAKKYSEEDYCEMCIRTGKKIRYYCGYIVLYQDYPFIDKWKKRLAKLLQ